MPTTIIMDGGGNDVSEGGSKECRFLFCVKKNKWKDGTSNALCSMYVCQGEKMRKRKKT